MNEQFRYQRVALGGTFDRLHSGHIALLRLAFRLSEQVVVGLTEDTLVRKKVLAQIIPGFPERKHQLEMYLAQTYPDRFEIVGIEDVYGVTLTDPLIEAVVVSEQTIEGAMKINQKREEMGLEILPVEIATMVSDESGEYLSSTRIRQGLVNFEGVVFGSFFDKDIRISESQKLTLTTPMGEVIPDDKMLERTISADFTKIAVVGDVALRNFITNKIPFDFGIFDNMTQRRKVSTTDLIEKVSILKVENQPGTISRQAYVKIRQMISEGTKYLEIEGEEDLLVLPFLLALPLHSVVYYGQPSKGLVEVLVDEKSKEKWFHFLTGE